MGDNSNKADYMVSDPDVLHINKRIDKLNEKFDHHNTKVVKKLGELHVDVKLMNSSTTQHKEDVESLDRIIRGNGSPGMLVRVATLEQRGSSKEKFAYLIIGCLITSCIGAIVVGIARIALNP